eukprot:m.113139 g.113139  ORF g.113139 m.113139 type:complete len:315 (+) comp28250_c0_seq4:220-1164(+)
MEFSYVDDEPDLSQCDGRFCGRTLIDGNLTGCGSCPRAFRSNGTTCEPCEALITQYSCLFLALNTFIVLLLHVWPTIRHESTPRARKVIVLCQFIEVTISVVVALLLVEPIGELSTRSCGVHSLADWYPWFNNPASPCNAMDCSNEAVYPLLTWVLIVDAVNVVLAVMLRLPASILCKTIDVGKDSIFSSLYALPLHALVHVAFGGLLYYAFPYILVVVGITLFTNWMASIETRASVLQRLKIWKDPLAQSMAVSSSLLIIGVGAMVSLFTDDKDEYWAACLLAPMVLVIVYVATEQFTSPDYVLLQMRFFDRA